MKKNKVGGARKNSGRKKIADPKEQLTLFVRKSIIEENGGSEQLKKDIYGYLGQE